MNPGGARGPARIGILTVSDRASRGEYADEGGPAIRACLAEFLASPWEAVYRVVPDERTAGRRQAVRRDVIRSLLARHQRP